MYKCKCRGQYRQALPDEPLELPDEPLELPDELLELPGKPLETPLSTGCSEPADFSEPAGDDENKGGDN